MKFLWFGGEKAKPYQPLDVRALGKRAANDPAIEAEYPNAAQGYRSRFRFTREGQDVDQSSAQKGSVSRTDARRYRFQPFKPASKVSKIPPAEGVVTLEERFTRQLGDEAIVVVRPVTVRASLLNSSDMADRQADFALNNPDTKARVKAGTRATRRARIDLMKPIRKAFAKAKFKVSRARA